MWCVKPECARGNIHSVTPKCRSGDFAETKTTLANLKARTLPANVVPIRGKHTVISALEFVGKLLGNEEFAEAMGVCCGESTKHRGKLLTRPPPARTLRTRRTEGVATIDGEIATRNRRVHPAGFLLQMMTSTWISK